MSEPFLGEIKMFAGNFAPSGYALCNGQIMPIAQNTALFSLLGTTYGGDWRSTFGLPNLQGITPLHAGQGAGLSQRDLGEVGGEASVTLTLAQLGAHSHSVAASDAVGGQAPTGNIWSKPSQRGISAYSLSPGTGPTMSPSAISQVGNGQPHNNLMPYLVVNFIIAVRGIFPSRN